MHDSLVSTAWLAESLNDANLRVVDMRGYVKTKELGNGHQHADYLGAPEEYAAGHILGAVYVDWTEDIVDHTSPVMAQIAPPGVFAAAMGQRGIGDDTLVVAVDHTGGHLATRLWWALRYYGHDNVVVLDGGMNRWVAEGRPVSTDLPSVLPATFTPHVQKDLRVEPAEILQRGPDMVVVDARDQAQYSGAVWRGTRGGHIPGAVNISAKALVNADGTWKPIEEQREIVAAAGVDPEKRVAAYCNGGVTATAVLFALHRLGFSNYTNYDGSWNEWGERPEYPATLGDQP